MDEKMVEARIRALQLRSRIIRKALPPKFEEEKHERYPKGHPDGGQFKPKSALFANLFGGTGLGGLFGGKTLADPNWVPLGKPQPDHVEPRKGSVKHVAKDDKGRDVYIHRPSTPTPADAPEWFNAQAVATVTPGSEVPKVLNGVPFEPWEPDEGDFVAGIDPTLEDGLPDIENHKWKHAAAGVIIEEPDGRIWLTRPTNGFGGYRHTFPKGTVEPGMDLQDTAIKETFEETGLRVEITGVLGDFERTTSIARYFIARRVGGTPSRQGWESQAMRLVPRAKALSFLNMSIDREILGGWLEEYNIGKAAPSGLDLAAIQKRLHNLELSIAKSSGSDWDESKHPRWPKGTPLGGQFMKKDANGIVLPPDSIGKGKAAENWKAKMDAMYAAAVEGDWDAVHALTDAHVLHAESKGWIAAGGNMSGKFKAAQYGQKLISDHEKKIAVEAKADKLAGPPSISTYKKTGAKPGGSNPGALYEDKKGTKYLVKGANHPSDDRAKNEVLASKLMAAAGVMAPDMHLVDLGDQYGGGLGVAAKWESLQGWSKSNAQHLEAAQSEFAVHAWLANYDSVGTPPGDNLAMKDGKPFNPDPGGALLYRAQGIPKDLPGGMLQDHAPEWESMRNPAKNSAAHSVYGSMSKSQLQASAQKLLAVDDKTIDTLVMAYGPGGPSKKVDLAVALKKRKAAILAKAGVTGEKPAAAAAAAVAPSADPLEAKGSQISPSGNEPAPVLAKQVLTNTTGTHNKFWTAEVEGTELKKTWGKIGTKGQSMSTNYMSHAAAVAAMQTQMAEKFGKGYVLDTEASQPTKPTTSAAAPYGDNISAKGKDYFKSAVTQIEMHVSAHGLGDTGGIGVGGHLNAFGALQLHNKLATAKTTAELSAAVTAIKDWSPHSTQLLNAKASLLMAANHVTVTMPGTQYGPGNPPTEAAWNATDSAGKLVPPTPAAAAAHQKHITELTGLHAAGDVNALQAKVNMFAKTDGLNEAGKANFAVKHQYAQALLDDLKGKQALGTPTIAPKFGPGNKPKASDFMAPNGMMYAADAHPGHLTELDKFQLLHTQGDLAELEKQAAYFAKKVETGTFPPVGGADAPESAWTSVLAPAGVHNTKVKAEYLKGLVRDLKAKQHAKVVFDVPAPSVSAAAVPYAQAMFNAAGVGDLAGIGDALEDAQADFLGLTKTDQDKLLGYAHDLKAAIKYPHLNAGGGKGGMPKGGDGDNDGILNESDKKPTGNPKDGDGDGILNEGEAKGKLASSEFTAMPSISWMGIANAGAHKGKVNSAMWQAKSALISGSKDKLQEAYDKLAEVKSAFKFGSKGRAKVAVAQAWIVDNASKAGLTVKGGKFEPATPMVSDAKMAELAAAAGGAAAAPDPKAGAQKLIQEVAGNEFKISNWDAPLAKPTLEAVTALQKGDDKAMATALGKLGIIAGGSPQFTQTSHGQAQALFEKLQDLATIKGGMPLSTGAAATIWKDPLKDDGAQPPPESGPLPTFDLNDEGEHQGKPAVSATDKPLFKNPDAWASYMDQFDAADASKKAQMLAANVNFLEVYSGNDDDLTHDTKAFVRYASNVVGTKPSPELAAAVVDGAGLAGLPAKPTFTASTPTAVEYYNGLVAKMDEAFGKGDMAALLEAGQKKGGKPVWPVYQSGSKAGQPKTTNGKLLAEYQGQLMSALSAKTDLANAAAIEKPVGVVPGPGENKGSLPAMPNFTKAKIAENNTNAASHNKKVGIIADLAAKGDVKGLLGLNYGTNTYGKKQAALANDALAALGSGYQVDLGQKKGSHPALKATSFDPTGGKSAALSDSDLPPKLDFQNWNAAGKGLSSKAHINAANQKDYDALTALAKAGDFNAVKNYQFEAIDPETGAPTGQKKPIGQHPSQHVTGHWEYLVQTMDEKLNPPKPLEIFEAKQAAASVAKLAQKFPPKPLGITSKKVPSSQAIGHWIALGQVKGHESLVPAKQKNFDSAQEAQAKADYALWKHDTKAQAFRSAVQGHGGHEYHGGWDHPTDTAKGSYGSSHSGEELINRAKAAHKWARKQPPGTKIYKWENLSPDAKAKLEKAQPGLIIQNPAPACASKSSTATKGFGSSHRWNIIFTEGAKALNSFASGSHPSEQEVTLLPNHRFVILSHKKATGHAGYSETTVLLLPPDPALDSDGYTNGYGYKPK